MVNINVIGGVISISLKDETKVVPYTKSAYEKLTKLAEKANNADTVDEYNKKCDKILVKVAEYTQTAHQLVTSKCDWLEYNTYTQEYFLTLDGRTVSDIPMPQSLVDRIMDSIDKGVDFMPVIKLWTRFLRNPNLKTKGREFARRFAEFVNMKYVDPRTKNELIEQGIEESVATELSTIYQIKITQEGLLNGYKVSREILHKFDEESGERVSRYSRTFNVDTGEISSEGLPEHVEDRIFEPAIMQNGGHAFYCGDTLGHFIRVGKVHRLESWDQVNCFDQLSCVPGLHVGGLYYINCYSGEIHNVFVDPMHIGAIPDSRDGAIRCLQYFVHSSLAGVNGSMYHSSDYAKLTDKEWEDLRKEILESYQEMTNGFSVEALRKEVL
jgi:hypothetical protein